MLKMPVLESPNGQTLCDFTKHGFLNTVFLFNTIFVSRHMLPREPRRDPRNCRFSEHGIWYISDTARNRTHNLFPPKCAPIPLGHIDGFYILYQMSPYIFQWWSIFPKGWYFSPEKCKISIVDPAIGCYLVVNCPKPNPTLSWHFLRKGWTLLQGF